MEPSYVEISPIDEVDVLTHSAPEADNESPLSVMWRDDYQGVGINKAIKYGWTVQIVPKCEIIPLFLESEYFTVEKRKRGDIVLTPILLLE